MKQNIIIATAFICCSYAFGQDYLVANIPQTLKKNANTVIRKETTELLIKKIDDLTYKTTDVKTILTKAGEDNSVVYLHYNKETKIGGVKVRVLDEFGKVTKTYSKKDFQDISASGPSELYTDHRALVLPVISNNFPYTLEVVSEYSTGNSAFIPTFTPFDSRNVSVESREFKIINNSGVKLRKKIVDNTIAKVNISGDDDNLVATYSNVPAIDRENYSPNLEMLLPKVEFSLEKFSLAGKPGDLSTWNAFGLWYNNLLKPVSVITPEIKKEVDALQLSGPVSERVKTLYQYMQDKTRYIYVGIGIGGWQPMPADEVRKKGYGDCKGLTNYMRVLLEAAGIPSHYAIIYSDNTPRLFDVNFPRMDGNHAILMVPTEKGNVWLENTSQKVAFNHIGYKNSNRNVMLIKNDGIELMNTPIYTAEQSNETMRLKANILEDYSIDGIVDFRYTGGLYDFNYYFDGMAPTDLKDVLKSRFYGTKFQNLDISTIKNDRNQAVMDLAFKFKASDHAKKMGNDIFFGILPLKDSNFYLEHTDERALPLEIPFAYNDDYEIEYTLPKGYKLAEMPKPVLLTSDYGNYELVVDYKEDKVVIKRKFTVKRMTLEQSKIKNYIEFRKKANNHDNTKLLITKI